MSYSVNTTSQNVRAAKQEHYTKEQLKEDLKERDAKNKPYRARPGMTAWGFEKEQMANQGPYATQPKKRGIRGLFARDHAKGAEKEARKELIHAEKAERYAQRARDPALNERQRRKFLRKAAKQQASADFHESLKKKHVIGSTPGHKYQAVPAMATHHPIVHDNTTNTVRTTVNDQSFTPSRMPIGPAAFDGIAEVGSRQAALEPHPAVLNVSNNIKPQQRWEGQVSADRKLSSNQPAYIPTGDRAALPHGTVQQPIKQYDTYDDDDYSSDDDSENENIQQNRVLPFTAAQLQQGSQNLHSGQNWRERKALFSRGELRQGADRLQFAPTQVKQGRWFNDNQLRTQGTQLRKVQTIEKGGLSSYDDEWSRRRRWQSNQRSMSQQQINQGGYYQYNQLYSQQIRDQIHGGKFTTTYDQPQSFVMYASQPALQRKASTLRKTETRQSQGNWLQQGQLRTQGTQLRKVQTIEKGGLSAYAHEFIKNRQQNRNIQQQSLLQQPMQQQQLIQQQPIQQLSKEQQRALIPNDNVSVTVTQTQVISQ